MSRQLKRVKLTSLSLGPLQHTTLPPMLVTRIRVLHERFKGLSIGMNYDLATWIEGFMYDLHPEREVTIWEAIAQALDYFIAGREVSHEVQDEAAIAFLSIISATSGKEATKNAKHLTKEDKERVFECLALAWAQSGLAKKVG